MVKVNLLAGFKKIEYLEILYFLYYRHMKKITLDNINNKRYIFLTKNNYSPLKLNNEITIISRNEYQRRIIEANIFDLERLLDFLKSNIECGIYIICLSNNILVFNSFLGTELSYYDTGSQLYISDSSLTIAEKLNLKLSKEAISTYLVAGLPYFPFYTMSLWKNINKLPPLKYLKITEQGEFLFINVSLISDNIHKNKTPSEIKATFIKKINTDISEYKDISLDISGGIDSAVIAYLLNNTTSTYSAYHSYSIENSDTDWAKFIANDLGNTLNILESIGNNNNRFEVNSEFLGGNIPDSPLLWGDTEGYVLNLVKKIRKNKQFKNLHFIGIGGDDLFSPMPSAPWSIAKNNGLKGFEFLIKYSVFSRSNFITCLKSFLDQTRYSDDLTKKIYEAFDNSTQKQKLLFSWNEEITIPSWLTKDIRESLYSSLMKVANEYKKPLNNDRAKNQEIQSLLFQNSILSQLNRLSPESIYWSAPYLNPDVIENSLFLSEFEKYNPTTLKPFLKKMMDGIMPEELFYRGSKGDYSTTLYESYRLAKNKYNGNFKDFELFKLGIIDLEILEQELSMPTANPIRIDFFEKLCNMERWLRQLKRYSGELYEKNL